MLSEEEVVDDPDSYFLIRRRFRNRRFEFRIPTEAYIKQALDVRENGNGYENYWKFVTPGDPHIDRFTTKLVNKFAGKDWRRKTCEIPLKSWTKFKPNTA